MYMYISIYFREIAMSLPYMRGMDRDSPNTEMPSRNLATNTEAGG